MVKVGDIVKITNPYYNHVVQEWFAHGTELEVTDVYQGDTTHGQRKIRVIDVKGVPMRLTSSEYAVVQSVLSIETESQEL